jgi:hypothetical protein
MTFDLTLSTLEWTWHNCDQMSVNLRPEIGQDDTTSGHVWSGNEFTLQKTPAIAAIRPGTLEVKRGDSQCCFEPKSQPFAVVSLWTTLIETLIMSWEFSHWSWIHCLIKHDHLLCHLGQFRAVDWQTSDHNCAKFIQVCWVWGQMSSCVEHTDHIWSPAEPHFVISDQDKKRWSSSLIKIRRGGQENFGILWSVLLKGENSLTGTLLDPCLGCVKKNPRNPMVVKLFYRNSNST